MVRGRFGGTRAYAEWRRGPREWGILKGPQIQGPGLSRGQVAGCWSWRSARVPDGRSSRINLLALGDCGRRAEAMGVKPGLRNGHFPVLCSKGAGVGVACGGPS